MEKERKIEILKDLLIQLSDSANILCTCEADERCEVIEEYVKALEDKTIITMKKGTLKCSNQGYVVYNKDWFRKHFATEVMVMTGYDGYMEKPTSDDCVSRQAVLEYIEGSDAELGHSSENKLVCQDIKEFPPVTPTKCIATVKFSKEDIQELIDEKMKDIAVERKKGKWIFTKTIFDKYGCTVECPSCHKKWKTYDEIRWKKENKFCPNCGAEMESNACKDCYYNDGEVHAECVVCGKAEMESEE